MNRIGLITYDHPHLKTEQVAERILPLTNFQYIFYALPFSQRKTRNCIVNHRPDQGKSVHPEYIARKFKIPFVRCNFDYEIKPDCDLYIILGSGILSADFIAGKKILNCHPGILPAVRGLDSFKWAIHDNKQLGVTLHYINEEVDMGEVVFIRTTNIYETDDLNTLARRHYENEISLISTFDKYLGDSKKIIPVHDVGTAKKRMPLEIEEKLQSFLGKYVAKWSSL